MVTLGLPFLRELFTADHVRRAELVLSSSHVTSIDLQRTFHFLTLTFPTSLDLRSNPVNHLSSYQDSVEEPSIGWYWEWWNGRIRMPGYHTNKGLRDWGYVFWDKRRMMAALPIDS